MVDLNKNDNTFRIHPNDQATYGNPGSHSKSFLLQLKDNWYKDFELIKSIEIKDDKVIKEEFHGDIMDDINISEREQYQTLMNTFLTREQKRKLSRYKGFKSFTDRIYGK